MNIKEAGETFHVSPDTLRYWERVGAIPKVNRDTKGHRDYDQEDQDWIYYTKCMRDTGVSIERIIEYIQLFKEGDTTITLRKQLLEEQLDEIGTKLAEMQKSYHMLENKINHYDESMLAYEGKLRINK